MDLKQLQKLEKKRGFYFYNVFDKPLAEKYELTPLIIYWIREQVVFRKKSRQDICISITNALQNGSYLTAGNTPKGYRSIRDFILARTKTLKFLLRCNEEDFNEITRLCMYDYDYSGDDRKMPSREEARKIRNLNFAQHE